MPITQNIPAIQAALVDLEPRIIGQEQPAWSCCCGAIHGSAAIATKIKPTGDTYPGQETMWYVWSVEMTPKPGTEGHGWSCGLSQFVPVDELEQIFARHFGPSPRTA